MNCANMIVRISVDLNILIDGMFPRLEFDIGDNKWDFLDRINATDSHFLEILGVSLPCH